MNIKKAAFLIFIITFAIYFNTLNRFFISDDFGYLRFLTEGNIRGLIYDHLPFKGGFFVRPIGALLWWSDYSLWRLNTIGYHVTNTIIHSLNSLLVALIAFLILKDKPVSLFSGILFSLHPIHSEAVTWLSIRFDLLCTLFYLLTLFTFGLYTAQTRKWYVYLVSIISYPLALFSKEMAISLPAVLILYDFISTRKLKLKLYLPYILITLFYLIWRIAVIGDIGGYRDPSGQPLFFRDFSLMSLLKSIGYYLPLRLSFALNKEVFSVFYYRLFILLLMIGMFLAVYLRRKFLKMSIVLFAVAWILTSVIPVYDMLGIGDNLLSSRILYLPSVGFCILLAYFIGRNLSLQLFFGCLYVFILLVNNSAWNAAARIAGEVPRIAKNFFQHKEVASLKLYFYLPDTLRGVWGPLGNGWVPNVFSPLFAPLKEENLIVFSDVNPGSNFGYTSGNIDLRSRVFSRGRLGENIFFFRYNEENNRVEDVTAGIKSDLKNDIPKVQILNWDFHSEAILKEWKPYNLSYNTSSHKFIALNDDPYLVSPPLHIPPKAIGFIEIKIRGESKDNLVTPCEVYWISNKDKEYSHRRHVSFPLELDGKFHIYRARFSLYNPDWLEKDLYLTQIEFHPASCRAEIEIEYFRLVPWGWGHDTDRETALK